MPKSIAIAIFVKTPQLSPVKTRLAASIGKEAAIQVYENCLLRVEAKINDLRKSLSPEIDLTPYWAIAETEAMDTPRWKSFANIDQGPKHSLGDKLHHVFSTLKNTHDVVGVMGADSPFFSTQEIASGLRDIHNQASSACIGPTEDGGYYFFASNVVLPESCWTSVSYSKTSTRKEFLSALPDTLAVKNLSIHWDIDNKTDLDRAIKLDPSLLAPPFKRG